jgi:C-terminal processing protease CtpA/Prc
MGGSSFDPFYSGAYRSGGKRLGFIRIPSFEPDFDQGVDPLSAVVQFQREITYFQGSTDGLIVDVTRNPGGYPDYALDLLRRLIPRTFQALQYEMRATAELVQLFSAIVDSARQNGAPGYVVDAARAALEDVRQAYRENRGRTGPLPLDALLLNPPSPTRDIPPATDASGGITAYTKPVMVLVDETSFSAADMFPAVMQDNGAALIFGTRTAGLGGVTTGSLYDASAYSEARVSMTLGLMVRNNVVVTPDFPATPYVENVGVRPDVTSTYMTRENLLNNGRAYVNEFTAAMLAYIESKQ